jgi:hypothetical protein
VLYIVRLMYYIAYNLLLKNIMSIRIFILSYGNNGFMKYNGLWPLWIESGDPFLETAEVFYFPKLNMS